MTAAMTLSSHHQTISTLIRSDLTSGDQISFTVTSNSMQPIIRIGDTVTAHIVRFEELQRGDIIIGSRQYDFFTHRVISPIKGGWLTKGDNSPLTDPPLTKQDFIGRVMKVDKSDHTLDFSLSKWHYINRLMAKLGEFETKAYSYNHYFRLPFRFVTKLIQHIVE